MYRNLFCMDFSDAIAVWGSELGQSSILFFSFYSREINCWEAVYPLSLHVLLGELKWMHPPHPTLAFRNVIVLLCVC